MPTAVQPDIRVAVAIAVAGTFTSLHDGHRPLPFPAVEVRPVDSGHGVAATDPDS